MATATRQPVSDSAESAPPPVEEAKKKNLGGRPSNAELERRKLAKEAESAAAAQALAAQTEEDEDATAAALGIQKPGKLDFFEWLSQQFDPEQWGSDLFMYLWRSAPTIDRKGQGRGSAICKYAEYVDSNRIMLDQGSGDYRIDLCIVTQPSGKMNRIAQHRFQILNMDFPPKVPPGDWLDDPANSMWGWARGAIEAAANQRNQAAASGVTPAMLDPSAMFNTIATTFKSMQPAQQGTDPAIVAILQSLLGKETKPADNTMIHFLMEELKSQRAEAAEMRKEMRDQAAKNNAPKSLIDQLSELDPIVSRLSKGRPAPTEESGMLGIARDVLLKVIENGPQLLAAWSSGMTGRPAGGFQPNAAAQTVATTATAVPHAAPAAAIPKQEVPEPMQVSAEQEKVFAAVIDKYGQLFQACAAHMIDMFQNTSGFDFRDWFIDRNTIEKYRELKSDVTPQLMVDLVNVHTLLRTLIKPPEAALVFFTNFFDEDGSDEDADENLTAGIKDGEPKQ